MNFNACIATAVSVLCLNGISATASAKEPAARPNVVVIYSDDQGSLDLNCYGSTDLDTPNLDRLASQGVRFTQMYSPSAICSASRAGLMTGRIPARAGVPGNVSSAKGRPGMPSDEVTMAELLKSAGYVTGHVGKWHLGYTPETMPMGQGFDRTFGHMGGCIDNFSHFFYWNGPNRHDLWKDGKEVHRDGEFFLDMMVQEGESFIEDHQDEPFFMYWAINAPHYPMQGTSTWRERYKDLPSPRRQYAEFTSTVDERIGALLATLDRLQLREKTLVVFQSDHGHSTEERAFWGGGNAGPYRGAKASLFEGGIRIPSIVSMPGTVAEGEVCDAMAFGCDWFLTVAELCGAELPDRLYDGRSILSLAKDPTSSSPHETLYWLLGNGNKAQWAVRKDDWKLLGNVRDTTDLQKAAPVEKLFLVNLSKDIGETTNVANDHPQIVRELKAFADAKRKAVTQK